MRITGGAILPKSVIEREKNGQTTFTKQNSRVSKKSRKPAAQTIKQSRQDNISATPAVAVPAVTTEEDEIQMILNRN